ncbi:MAG: hypothetical protein GWO16_14590, partial [Gammaproteobacteria bacterium]|nr:hypothetical protein [Gammaproteobacteria bacterium]NIR98162.1 hypothetical protein [Gammaproteobacteria bacterium]NIT63831.1 hypothetical protein [Gammaproteobacteria bacterium]NIV21748.1 hypothetical protein [Gammaproteobacteria bacterium]NIY32411.1 hypothetical protein [Gammaproteobacteria bacterium]
TFPDGVTRNVEGAFVPDRGPEGECRGFIALVLDVSEAHAVQRERDQSRRLLETVLNAVPIEIFVKGRD